VSSVTDARSRDLNFDSGSRGDRGDEIQKTWSPVSTRDKYNYNLLSITFLETVDVREKTGKDASDISLSITFLETVDVREKTGEEDSDISLSESSSPVFTRTSTVSRKVMDNEISESSSPVFSRTSTVSRKVMDNEISLETFDVRVITGEDDSDISLSITFLASVDVRVITGEDDSDISLSITFLASVDVRVITMLTSGINDGNEDVTRNAFYTSSRYRTTKPLFEDIDNRNITLRSPDPDISLSITFLASVDVRVITGEDDSDISFSITFRGFSHAYEGVLSMASYAHLELERLFKLPCTYEESNGQ
jgi:hypothetical protein